MALGASAGRRTSPTPTDGSVVGNGRRPPRCRAVLYVEPVLYSMCRLSVYIPYCTILYVDLVFETARDRGEGISRHGDSVGFRWAPWDPCCTWRVRYCIEVVLYCAVTVDGIVNGGEEDVG